MILCFTFNRFRFQYWATDCYLDNASSYFNITCASLHSRMKIHTQGRHETGFIPARTLNSTHRKCRRHQILSTSWITSVLEIGTQWHKNLRSEGVESFLYEPASLEDSSLLGCHATLISKQLHIYHPIYRLSQHNIPEDLNLNQHCSEELKPCNG